MYYYIVDPQKISQKEFERVQNNLYSSLSEYRISGEVVRVTGLRTIQQLVENAFAHEAKTLVAVGSDDTLHEVINAVGKREMIIGFIPIADSEMSDVLGIKNLSQAVKTIAARRIQELDLGLVNDPSATQAGERAGYFFLSRLNFGTEDGSIRNFLNLPAFDVEFSADEKYHASQKIIGGIIVNSRNETKEITGNPTDGQLDILLLPKLSNWNVIWHRRALLNAHYEDLPEASILHVKKLLILQPAGMPIRIGNRIVAKVPATISVAEGQLKMIVGKDRKF